MNSSTQNSTNDLSNTSNGLTPFEFQSHPLRVIVGEHGEPWFIAKDVATILDYSDAHKMCLHLDDAQKQVRQIGGFGPRGVITINEPGLSMAITNSHKPEAEAEAFATWVCNEVLPSFRLPQPPVNESGATDSVQVKPVVILHDGKAITASQAVAGYFGKEHKNVLRSIENIKADLPEDFNRLNFEPVEFFDAKGEKRPAYELTRDAFTLLAMGFTGKTALAFKLAYIQAFNRMEMELLDTRRPLPQDPAPVLPPPAKEPGVTRLLVTMREGQQPTTETLSPNKHVLSLNDFTELARKTGFLVISKEELNRLFGNGNEG